MLILKYLMFFSLSAFMGKLEVFGKLLITNYDTYNDTNFKILHKCVASIVYRYYEGRTLMFYPNEINDSFGEGLLIKGINATAAIKRKNKLKSWEAYHKFYILLPFGNKSTFSYYNNLVYKAEKSSFMLIVWPPNTSMKDVSKVHDNFWKFRLIKVASFIQEKSGDVNVYVYFPFNEKNCGDGKTIHQVDKCTSDGFQSNFDLFSGITRLLNFHGCKLKCFVGVQYPHSYLIKSQNGSWEIKGNINYMLDTFKAHYNVTLSFYNLFNFMYNWYFYNISLETVLRAHENESYEFGVGAFSLLSRNDNPFIEFTFGPDPECIAWAIPIFAGDRPSIWITLVSEFPLIVWCLIGLAIATGITFISVSTLFEDKNLSRIKVIHISLMMIFAITAESPKMKSRFKSVNMFLFKWCLWGLVVRCAYEASLGSLLTITVPAQQLKSNKELLDRNFRVAGGVKMYEILEEAATDKVLKKLIKKFEILPPSSGKVVLEQINSLQNLAVLQPAHYTNAIATLIAKERGLSNVAMAMSPCLVNTFSSPMIIRKGSFMSQLLTAFSTRIFESGLSINWRKINYVSKEMAPQESSPLALQKLRGVFVFYFTGIGIATLVFAFEMVEYKFKKNRSFRQ